MVTDQMIIEDWETRKEINDALPKHEHQKIEKEEELERPMFQANAIGALHEAAEAYLLSKKNRILILSNFLNLMN